MSTTPKSITTLKNRAFAYLSIFIITAIMQDIVNNLLKPVAWSNSSIGLALLTVIILLTFGFIHLNERTILSRVSSAATLFLLGTISLRFGNSFAPDSYLLASALIISIIGALPVLHKEYVKPTVYWKVILIIFVTTLIAGLFTYAMKVSERVLM